MKLEPDLTSSPDLSSSVHFRDQQTAIVYIEVPPEKVVLFQAFFELYEGLGLVRTLDLKKNLLCVLTTASQLEDCLQALSELKSEIDWIPAKVPSLEEQEKYLGFFKNAKQVQ
jgi:hypothetical protein